MGYRVVDIATVEWAERPPKPGEEARRAADVTTAGGLQHSRARLWRYPPHSTGRRHQDHEQEEVFVVVSGTLTMLLGDPPERHDLPPESVVTVATGTGIQMRNESDDEVVVFAYGAPPVTGQTEHLDDLEL